MCLCVWVNTSLCIINREHHLRKFTKTADFLLLVHGLASLFLCVYPCLFVRERRRKNKNTVGNFLCCSNALFNIPLKQCPRPQPYNLVLQCLCTCVHLCTGALWCFQALVDISKLSLSLSLYFCVFSFQEKLMYFPVCVSKKKKSEDETEEGLGSLPRNISSVSSLLLFNTTENL